MGVNALTVDSGFLRVFSVWLVLVLFFFPVLLQYDLRVVYKVHGDVVSP